MTNAPLPGWPFAESPFHDGERAVQQRLGVERKLEVVGRHAIRNLMPEQHREFFPQLPLLLAGSVDQEGQPWASVLAGAPGFCNSPDPEHLNVRARPLFADPLQHTLAVGATIGLLGIEPHTRRRNRMNSNGGSMSSHGFAVRVNRSFGNCPKYIQARAPQFVPELDSREREKPVLRANKLDPVMLQMIRSADTFYIATAAGRESTESECPHGADISHRGGKPGFVRVDDAETLTAPDFTGNFFFNTLGNIVAHPKAGLLFIDFSSGDLLYLAADVEIIWSGTEVESFQGAQRLLRFHVRQALLVRGSLPLRWSDPQQSPFLDATGDWKAADELK